MTGAVVAAIVGVVIGWLLAVGTSIITALLRRRQHIAVRIPIARASYLTEGFRLRYMGEPSSDPMVYDKLPTQDSSSAHALVVETVIHIENPSEIDDAITRLTLSIGQHEGHDGVQYGVTPENQKLFGVNVPAHQMVSLDLQFTFSIEEFGKIEGWNYSDRPDGVEVSYSLVLGSLLGREFRFRLTPKPNGSTPTGCVVDITNEP